MLNDDYYGGEDMDTKQKIQRILQKLESRKNAQYGNPAPSYQQDYRDGQGTYDYGDDQLLGGARRRTKAKKSKKRTSSRRTKAKKSAKKSTRKGSRKGVKSRRTRAKKGGFAAPSF